MDTVIEKQSDNGQPTAEEARAILLAEVKETKERVQKRVMAIMEEEGYTFEIITILRSGQGAQHQIDFIPK